MKGLASTSPSFARVRVSGRSARKYYGISNHTKFVSGEHDCTERSVSLPFEKDLLTYTCAPDIGALSKGSFGLKLWLGSSRRYITAWS